MKRILIIDDDLIIRQILRDLLEPHNYHIVEASNGAEGLNLQLNNPFDLIVTDIVMPEKEGIETIIELSREFPETKIIAISGQGKLYMGEYLEMAEKLGADAIFSKPIEPEVFVQKVKMLIP